jgi:hypothetical protein
VRYDVEWRKGGKGGNNQHQTSEDVELELRADLVVCSKTVPWHYQDNNVSRFAFGCCVCRILCQCLPVRAPVHCGVQVVVLLVRTVFTCDCLYTCMYYCTLPAHYFLSPFFFPFFFGCVRCIVWLPLPDTSDAVLLADTWLDGLGKRSKCQLTELLLLLRLVWIRPRRSIGS